MRFEKTEKRIFTLIGVFCLGLIIILATLFLLLGKFASEISDFEFNVETEEKTQEQPTKVQYSEKDAFLPLYDNFTSKSGYFCIGDEKADVVAVMGKPDKVAENSYVYEYSTVYFDTFGVVCGYVNIGNKLKVHIGDASGQNSEVQINYTPEMVVSARGTPDRYYGRTWYYGDLRLHFDNDYRVIEIVDEK